MSRQKLSPTALEMIGHDPDRRRHPDPRIELALTGVRSARGRAERAIALIGDYRQEISCLHEQARVCRDRGRIDRTTDALNSIEKIQGEIRALETEAAEANDEAARRAQSLNDFDLVFL